HRVKKEIYNTSGSLTRTDYYVRDVAGSVLAIYNNSTLTEHAIYGSGRLGIYFRQSGSSVYQLTDHLGNVRAVVSSGGLTNATDYYPGGMPMPNRQLTDGTYRYGYQGDFAETDPETGKPAFELRLYDPRINRWLTTDPYGEFHSPYLAMGNNWPNVVDSDGGMTGCPPGQVCTGTVNQLEGVTVTGVDKSNRAWTSEVVSSFSGSFSQWKEQFGFTGDYEKVLQEYRVRYGNSYQAPSYNALADVDFTSFAASWRAGALGWEEGSIGSDWMMISSTLIGGALSIVGPSYGGAAFATRSRPVLSTTKAFTHADDIILYSTRIHRAPKGGIIDLSTGTGYHAGRFLPNSIKGSLNFGRGVDNIIYQPLYTRPSYINPATNALQVYLGTGTAGTHVAVAPYLLLNSRR
ncbi:hypothetical protein, partial [Leptobacterium sp. I13]|uniref:hypothetical protein n=1 Tax=Leptobacterium meishanense TaxID=3128904 RepID=UPI0030EB9A70